MINPNEAPSGTIAVKSEVCRGCVFVEGINECSQKGPKIIPCVSGFRDDKTSVIFKLKQPDLLNAATHEQRKQTVAISAELSDAYVALLRAAEAEGDDCVPRSPRLTYAKNAVIRAGGGA